MSGLLVADKVHRIVECRLQPKEPRVSECVEVVLVADVPVQRGDQPVEADVVRYECQATRGSPRESLASGLDSVSLLGGAPVLEADVPATDSDGHTQNAEPGIKKIVPRAHLGQREVALNRRFEVNENGARERRPHHSAPWRLPRSASAPNVVVGSSVDDSGFSGG